MKLITEKIEDVEFIIESSTEGKKKYYIEGVFLQSNTKNRNGRIYPKEILQKEVERYTTEEIDKNKALGECGHPDGPNINLDRVSHKIISLKEDGDNWIGKALVLDTPHGKIIQDLLNGGVQIGVSSRGLGTLKESNGSIIVQSDFFLATAADCVSNPSAPLAYVKGIMEDKEWFITDEISERKVKESRAEIESAVKSRSLTNEEQTRIFTKFINSLVIK